MDTELRRIFNRAFSEQLYRSYREELSRRLASPFEFRLAESPVFLPPYLRDRLSCAATEIVEQLGAPELLVEMKRAVPREWDTPGMNSLPSFTQVDLAIVREADGSLGPRLIELQGFPSLTAMQIAQRDVWAETLQSVPALRGEWSCWFGGLSRQAAVEIAGKTILGNEDPENVILMDLDPPSQKTWPDFAATKLFFGVDAVCPTRLIRRGRQLWRRLGDDREVPVHRIYNRVVFDELIRKRVTLPFDFRDELDVTWVPHPNWYWVWSKFSIPLLRHPAVPKAVYLSRLPEIPDELTRRFVLKPLFSFAGGGVRIDPTREDIEGIPERDRGAWCLQEKIRYEPALLDPDGNGVKVEIRLMFFKPDDAPKPVLVQNLCRLSRGAMLGVDFNKNFTWVGSSVALWPASPAVRDVPHGT